MEGLRLPKNFRLSKRFEYILDEGSYVSSDDEKPPIPSKEPLPNDREEPPLPSDEKIASRKNSTPHEEEEVGKRILGVIKELEEQETVRELEEFVRQLEPKVFCTQIVV